MSVVKLNISHVDSVTRLLHSPLLLQDAKLNTFVQDGVLSGVFCEHYLSDLNNFHAYGSIHDGEVTSLISFYESETEPAWYSTSYVRGDDSVKDVLDAVILHNEQNGRLKFYNRISDLNQGFDRTNLWNTGNNARYDYIDEYMVPAQTKCVYSHPFELLYFRYIYPENTIVRCNFLKQQYRVTLPQGGNI